MAKADLMHICGVHIWDGTIGVNDGVGLLYITYWYVLPAVGVWIWIPGFGAVFFSRGVHMANRGVIDSFGLLPPVTYTNRKVYRYPTSIFTCVLH